MTEFAGPHFCCAIQPRRSITICLLVATLSFFAPTRGIVSAQTSATASNPPHTVWLAPAVRAATDSDWFPRAITNRSGRVLSLDGQFLVLRTAGDEEDSKVAAERVIWIRCADRTPAETAAIGQHQQGNYGEALVSLIRALGSENDPTSRPPVWRQQWLSMLAARAAWRSNRAEIALELVSQLDQRSLPPMTLAQLPIAWTAMPRENVAAAVEAATRKSDSPSAAVRLVCASWLLESPTKRSDAEAMLQTLAGDAERPRVAELAGVLAWKSSIPGDVADQWPQWERRIDELPLVLQTGPLQMLSAKMESAGLADNARRVKLSLQITPLLEKVE